MKKNKTTRFLLTALCVSLLLGGCGSKQEPASEAPAVTETALPEAPEEPAQEPEETKEEPEEQVLALEDGIYLADFTTDSSMFHVNEVFEGKGVLTVEEGKGTIHIVLTSKNIVNLYEGLAADAEKEEANWLQPQEEEVLYPDGLTDTVHAFDVPVPYLDREFDLALIGKKQVWYDHKVSVSNPEPYIEICYDGETQAKNPEEIGDRVLLTLEGGSGKATVASPAEIKTGDDDGKYLVVIWSSPYYDYMILDGEKYLPVNTEGNSVFELPIVSDDCVLSVTADTVAMSTPHEIAYTLTLKPEK